MFRALAIATSFLFASAVFADPPIVPDDTPAWRVGDALDEYLNERSTPLEREVGRLRLRNLLVRDWLAWAGNKVPAPFDPDSHQANTLRFRRQQQAAWDLFLQTDEGLAKWYNALPETKSRVRSLPLWAMELPRLTRVYLVDTVRFNVDELLNGTKDRRYQAALNLERIRPLASPAIPALRQALKDEDADVRDAASQVLGTAEALQFARRGRWIDQLRDDEVKFRVAAATSLAEDHFVDEAIGKTIVQAMKGGELARVGLVIALERSWREQVDLDRALALSMHEANDPTRRLVMAAAMKIVAAASADAKVYQAERGVIVDDLKKRMGKGKSSARLLAMRSLVKLQVKPSEMIDELGAAALSDDPDLRYEASQLLMEAGSAGVSEWLAMFKDPRREVKGLALAEALTLGTKAKPAQRATMALLKDDDAAIRRMAAEALGAMGPAAKEAIDPLLEGMKDSDPDVREQSLYAARLIAPGDARVASALYQKTHDANVAAREQARRYEAEARTTERPNPLELLEQLRSKDPAVRTLAARKMFEKHVLPVRVATALRKAVEGHDFAVREGLVLGIQAAWVSNEEVEVGLKRAAEEEKDPARRAYLRAAVRAVEEGK